MFQVLRRHLSYANVAATLALVFAVTGGALAAGSNGGGVSGGGSAKAGASVRAVAGSKKSKKGSAPAGKPGPRGPAGATGPAGPSGSTGPAGATGPVGASGTNGTGTAGANGQSVTSAPLGVGNEHCKAGGSEFASASGPSYACNGKEGKEGAKGATGEPWTPNNTLPPRATETGVWNLGSQTLGKKELPLSFPVALSERIYGSQSHFVYKGEEAPPGCTGGTVEIPTAEPGNLCVYANRSTAGFSDKHVAFIYFAYPPVIGGEGAGTTGVFLDLEVVEESPPNSNESYVGGTWAVTEKEAA
jgi:hypothetical protein